MLEKKEMNESLIIGSLSIASAQGLQSSYSEKCRDATNPQFLANLVTFTEEILNGKFHFLCSV